MPYLQSELSVSEKNIPEMAVLQLYKLGIESCKNKNKEKFKAVITALIHALNFEYEEMANSFYDIYQFALRMVADENYEQAQFIFHGLQEAWEKAFTNKYPKLNDLG